MFIPLFTPVAIFEREALIEAFLDFYFSFVFCDFTKE